MRILGLVCFFCAVCNFGFSQKSPKRELRGVWISTVYNKDWPTAQGLSSADQQAEFESLLDMHRTNGLNAVFVQVRPCADALYNSPFEPWSKVLSGTLGQAPEPYYDPLEFMVKAAHNRGMEFHAWINPYRAWMDTALVVSDSMNIINRKPEWFLAYGKRLYFDPGIPEVGDYLVTIASDIASRFDVDGIHMDDYFYPYPIWGQEFPDTASFAKYGASYMPEQKADWRRANVDTLIHHLSDTLKVINPDLKFGISPFGIWRNRADDPRGSDSKGTTNYDHLYADVLHWLNRGWVDYVVPQLYWHIGQTNADYEKLLKWWATNSHGKHLYIGHAAYKADPESAQEQWQNPSELPNQVRLARQIPAVKGSVFFTSGSFLDNLNGIADSLREGLYRKPALIPIMDWKLRVPPPLRPIICMAKVKRELILTWEAAPDRGKELTYAIYRFAGKASKNVEDDDSLFVVQQDASLILKRRRKLFKKKYTFVVTAIDQWHRESVASEAITVRL